MRKLWKSLTQEHAKKHLAQRQPRKSFLTLLMHNFIGRSESCMRHDSGNSKDSNRITTLSSVAI